MAKNNKPMVKLVPEEELPPLTYSERAEACFIPTYSQSLLESIRGDLPEDDGPDRLVALATRQPGLYATLLGKLIAGSSFKAACVAIGVPYQQIYYWLQQGSTDLADDRDTYCSRLLLDCQRAQAMGVSDAEERVHKNNPERWLGKGSAVEFHKGKYWKDQHQITQNPEAPVEQQDVDPLDPPPIRQIEHDQETEDTGEQELQEALKVLEDHNITTDPEFYKQAREQYRLEKPDDPKET